MNCRTLLVVPSHAPARSASTRCARHRRPYETGLCLARTRGTRTTGLLEPCPRGHPPNCTLRSPPAAGVRDTPLGSSTKRCHSMQGPVTAATSLACRSNEAPAPLIRGACCSPPWPAPVCSASRMCSRHNRPYETWLCLARTRAHRLSGYCDPGNVDTLDHCGRVLSACGWCTRHPTRLEHATLTLCAGSYDGRTTSGSPHTAGTGTTCKDSRCRPQPTYHCLGGPHPSHPSKRCESITRRPAKFL